MSNFLLTKKPLAATTNSAPTLTSVKTLAGGTEDSFKEISFDELAAAADESDANGDAVSFRIEGVTSGTLEKWDGSSWKTVTAGSTLLGAGEKLRWQGNANANGELSAFTVRAWDGSLASDVAVQVKIQVQAVNDAPAGQVLISGAPAPGRVLTATYSLEDADGLEVVSLQWYADGVAIAGANTDTLTLKDSQLGQRISVSATYVDGGGTTESVSSKQLLVVTPKTSWINTASDEVFVGTSALNDSVTFPFDNSPTSLRLTRNADGSITVIDQAGKHGTDVLWDIEFILAGDSYPFDVNDLIKTWSIPDTFASRPSDPKYDTYLTASVGHYLYVDSTGFHHLLVQHGPDPTKKYIYLESNRDDQYEFFNTDSVIIEGPIQGYDGISLRVAANLDFSYLKNLSWISALFSWEELKAANGGKGVTIFATDGYNDLNSKLPENADTSANQIPITWYALDGDDRLELGKWNVDIAYGGNGNDYYILWNKGDKAIEKPNEGFDIVYVDVDNYVFTDLSSIEAIYINPERQGVIIPDDWHGIVLDHLIENRGPFGFITGGNISGHLGKDGILGGLNDETIDAGSGDDFIDGSGGKDLIYGGEGSDTLYGGTGADSLNGGEGDDTYQVDNLSDSIRENKSSGNDTVIACVDFKLDENLENLTLDKGATQGTGNDADNLLCGNDGGNILNAGAGNDTITGGDGNDLVKGGDGEDEIVGGDGAGDDTYYGGSGNDTVRYTSAITGIAVNLALGTADGSEIGHDLLIEIENIIGGKGNDLLIGDAGANRINGYSGTDSMYGGAGDDVYVADSQADLVFENSGEGTDTVQSSASFYLYAHIENLTLISTAYFGVGNELANTLTGNSSQNLLIGWDGNDTIFGGDARDALYGCDGNDVLYGDAGVDYIVAGNGNDAIYGGTDADEIYGEDGNDLIYGGDDFATDILVGGAGNDTIDGGQAWDLMYGGLGDDVFYVSQQVDFVFEEAGQGYDTVYANSPNGFYLYANIEALFLLGTTPFGVGNELDNKMVGSASDNWLLGGAGNDTLDGGAGTDVLYGQDGSDTFRIGKGTGVDIIADFEAGTDKIDLSAFGYKSLSEIKARMLQVGSDISVDLGNGDSIIIYKTTIAALTTTNLILQALPGVQSSAADEALRHAAEVALNTAHPNSNPYAQILPWDLPELEVSAAVNPVQVVQPVVAASDWLGYYHWG